MVKPRTIEPVEGYIYLLIGSNLTVHLVRSHLGMGSYYRTRCGIYYRNRKFVIEENFDKVILMNPTHICVRCRQYAEAMLAFRPAPIKITKRKPRHDIHTIMRRIGTDETANAGHALSGSHADTYIASWLNDGWELQSVHLLDSVHIIDYQPTKKRWWQFWKPKFIELDYGHSYDVMWILLRTR